MTTDTIPTIEREIKYSRQDRDYACYVNGQYIGSRANYSDAETLCDQVAYDLIADGLCATATELDGGSEPDAMAADHAVVAPANISEPAATTDRQGNTAYAVVVTYQSMPLRYRLHNEWTYGVDCRGAFADSAPMWYGTDMDALNLPAETITALRALWESLFTPSPDAPITPARHWSHRLPAYGADNCAGCGGPVPCDCDDDGRTPTAPIPADADRALSTCPGAFGPCGAETHPSYAPFCQKCALGH